MRFSLLIPILYLALAISNKSSMYMSAAAATARRRIAGAGYYAATHASTNRCLRRSNKNHVVNKYNYLPSSRHHFLATILPSSSSSSSSSSSTSSTRKQDDELGRRRSVRDATTKITAANNVVLPSTLRGPPVRALVAPGHCQFDETPITCKLLQRYPVSPTSTVFRFELPDKTQPLNLSTCACLLAHAEISDEDGDGNKKEDANDNNKATTTRPYTPISTNADVGYFDLLVKDYGANGYMSRYLHTLEPGDTSISFSHIKFNVKIQAIEVATKRHVGMIVGGTGITPMIQALHAILGDNDDGDGQDQPKVTLLYGSRNSHDILGKELLDQWVARYGADRFEVVYVLSDEPTDSDWSGRRGFVDQKLIEQYLPPSKKDGADDDSVMVFVCGPPILYDVFCGPRNEPDNVTGLLGDLGYSAAQVYKF